MLTSLTSQTFPQWELIVIDDGSTDRTPDIIRNYQQTEPRIRAFFTGGIGRGEALNLAAAHAECPLIANMDADDLMHPERLERQWHVMRANPELFLAGSDSLLIHGDERPVWPPLNTGGTDVTPIGRDLLRKNPISHTSVIMRKARLEKLGGYNAARKSQYDYDLWLRALAANEPMVNLPDPLVATRIHARQSFENKRRFHYLYRSCLLQSRHIVRSKQISYLAYPALRMIAGMLPYRMREKIQSWKRPPAVR
nr:glycosyltransferase [Salisediminibacterium haloalkalitolerans]